MNKFYRFQDENIILSNVSERIQQCKSFADIADEMRKDDLMYAMTCVIKSECIDESVNPEEKIQMRFRNKMFVLYDSDDIDLKKSVGEKFIPYNMDGRDIIPNMNGFIGRCLILPHSAIWVYRWDTPVIIFKLYTQQLLQDPADSQYAEQCSWGTEKPSSPALSS